MHAALVLLLALSAPAPLPKPPPTRPAAVGVVWALEWHGSHGFCELHKGGRWWCFWAGKEWAGTWRVEGDTLHVEEWMPALNEWGTPSGKMSWSATVRPGVWEGKTGSGGTFALRKPK